MEGPVLGAAAVRDGAPLPVMVCAFRREMLWIGW